MTRMQETPFLRSAPILARKGVMGSFSFATRACMRLRVWTVFSVFQHLACCAM